MNHTENVLLLTLVSGFITFDNSICGNSTSDLDNELSDFLCHYPHFICRIS